jgi:hypothetical protein
MVLNFLIKMTRQTKKKSYHNKCRSTDSRELCAKVGLATDKFVTIKNWESKEKVIERTTAPINENAKRRLGERDI